MRFHDDSDFELEQRLRRIAANPQPDVPQSVYRRAANVANGELKGRANGVALVPVLRGGRRFGVRQSGALVGLAAALVVAVAAMGLIAGQRGPNLGATGTLSPAPSQGQWTGLEWHDITSMIGQGFSQEPSLNGTTAAGGLVSWSGGFALIAADGHLWTSKDGLSWSRGPAAPTWTMVGLAGNMLAAGDAIDQSGAGVWLSRDGTTWQKVTVSFNPRDCILVSSGVVAVMGHSWDTAPGCGLHATTDGLNWQAASPPFEMTLAQGLAIAAFGGGFLARGTIPIGSERMWTSTDGLTWSLLSPTLPYRSSWTLDSATIHFGLLGADSGLLHSSDGGATWAEDADKPSIDISSDQVVSDGTRIVWVTDGGGGFWVGEGDGHWVKLAQGGDIGGLPAGGQAMLLPAGVLWVAQGRVYFGQGLSGIEPRGSIRPVVTPTPAPSPSNGSCAPLPMRSDAAAALVKAGAVIVYEHNGGISCVDALYAIYSDGRVVSDFGDGRPRTAQWPADKVTTLLEKITTVPDAATGWFTEGWYSTYHPPCAACYRYSITITYKGQTKTVEAVDGGTDAMADYWLVTGYLAEALGITG